MLSAGCWLAAEVLDGFRVPHAIVAPTLAAFLGLVNMGVGWVAHGIVSEDWSWLHPPLAFLLRCPVDAVLLQLLYYLRPRTVQLRHFGSAVLAALIMSAFGTAGEVVVGIGFWILRTLHMSP